MKTILLSFTFIFLIGTLFSQSINHKGEETIIYESFEGGFPYNWDITWEGSPIGHGNWITNEYTMHPYNHPPFDGDMLIYFDSFTAYPGYYARLETPMNNFAAFSDATLTFFMFHDDELPDLNDQLIIQYKVDQGEWISLDTVYRVWENYNLEWVRHEIDLTETVCGNSNVTIAFWGISAYGNDINIDMIEVRGTSTAPVFVSEPIVEATVWEEYIYNIVVEDEGGDISQLEIIGEYVPEWLTFTDLGDGIATLTGTPGIGDEGISPVFLRAVDSDDNFTTQPFDIDVGTTGVGTNISKCIKIFPNPVTEFLNIDLSKIENDVVNIAIYNNIGSKIFEINKNGNENNFVWNLTSETGNRVSNGLYFVEISGADFKIIEKIILTNQ